METEYIVKLSVFLTLLAHGACGLLAYKMKVWPLKPTLSERNPKPQPLASFAPGSVPHGGFLESLCGCFQNLNICVTVLLFPVCRNVDTQVTAGVLDRKQAVKYALWQFFLPLGYFACHQPCQRAALRAHLGGEYSVTWTWTDVFASVCCVFCAVCQEAREVDKAVNAETRLFPRCAVVEYGTRNPVGHAIKVQV